MEPEPTRSAVADPPSFEPVADESHGDPEDYDGEQRKNVHPPIVEAPRLADPLARSEAQKVSPLRERRRGKRGERREARYEVAAAAEGRRRRPSRRLTIVVPRERREDKEDRRDIDGQLGQHRTEGVRQDVAEQDPPGRRSRRAGGLDERLVRYDSGSFAHRARGGGPQDEPEHHDEEGQAHAPRRDGREPGEHDDDEQERGDHREGVAHERDDPVEKTSFVETRDRPQQTP